MECVPGFETQDAEGEWYQSHGFQEDEDQDGDEDLLQFGFATSFISELDVDVQFFFVEIAWADGDFSSNWEFEGDVVGLHVILDGVEEVAGFSTSSHFVSIVVIAYNLNGFGDL